MLDIHPSSVAATAPMTSFYLEGPVFPSTMPNSEYFAKGEMTQKNFLFCLPCGLAHYRLL